MAEYINIEIKGLNETFRKLGALGSHIQRKASVDMTRATSGALALAVRKNCPVKTGNLRASIRSVQTYKRDLHMIHYQVGFTSGKGAKHDGYYAHVVEFGSQPHTIPKSKKPIPMVIGGNVFTGPIRHPGAKPTRFVTRSFEEAYSSAMVKGYKAFEKALVKYSA